MTTLLTLDKISLAFGAEPLLDEIKLQIESSERICLIGRNGAGKSSLLKIISGQQLPDSGEVWRMPNLKIGTLVQELPQQIDRTVFEEVALGLESTGKLLAEYHALIQTTPTEAQLKKLEQVQQAIDTCNGWQFDQQINTVLSRLELNAERKLSELSGGWQRRVALAKALVASPDLLLLDEPTNHLDISAIQWLEEKLLEFNGGLLFITHDRSLLQRLATRIIELDRGNLTSWPGNYANFLRRKEEMLAAEIKHNSEFDKKLSAEERWIRQGIKARRTRNEGRVRALEALRKEHAQRRNVQGTAKFKLSSGEESGKLVIEAENVTHTFGDKLIINNFSARIMRGDRIGLLGPNGAGKSTLLNILLDKLKPQQGSVRHGSKLQIAYSDQLRITLDPEKTILENFSHGTDTLEINGKSRHIISYLSDFLFTPQRLRTPVKALSGGERNRLMLANLFSKPTNLLVLDEPTNDLDIETLELLEELLAEYQGTLLLVSHDRTFLDNVVTSTFAFEGNGKVVEYVGGYQDWLRQTKINKPTTPQKVTSEKPLKPKTETKPKLSYNQQKELNGIPKKIEKLEQQQADLHRKIADPAFYQKPSEQINAVMMQIKQLEEELTMLYQRWEELEK